MKAVNIQWDIDLEEGRNHEKVLKKCGLPNEVEIPDRFLVRPNETIFDTYSDISDWLSDKYGFCHAGFELVD